LKIIAIRSLERVFPDGTPTGLRRLATTAAGSSTWTLAGFAVFRGPAVDEQDVTVAYAGDAPEASSRR
jgi:hypothetical protein